MAFINPTVIDYYHVIARWGFYSTDELCLALRDDVMAADASRYVTMLWLAGTFAGALRYVTMLWLADALRYVTMLRLVGKVAGFFASL
ncbi:hypothetical protein PGT21_035209 [Puccinia graminis f. sp. tritici]|uniref:Uncharacterized protein n=1 Tax=Puccinia graminis f. sp. tritici TaxID=56615 RepID=A0A5B0NQD9_PUCGR|nr:hypothetical protein PGTUg99_036523 [Puccinia graminis f. sp. tritici]KAA1091527.1 hypothetical protein PGT21_035209 [Puccinia graminis f. sp. tritici]